MKKLTLISDEQRWSDSFDDEEARWWWYGIRGRACESGWSVCDSIQKVPSVGHLRESHRGGHIRDAWGLELSVTSPMTFPEMPDTWNFLYAITNTPATFAHSSSYPVPSPSRFLIIKRVTSMLLIAYQSKFLHKLVIIASRISTIQRRTNE